MKDIIIVSYGGITDNEEVRRKALVGRRKNSIGWFDNGIVEMRY